MTGQVLDYSIQTNEGVISGDDHQRYRFAGSDWPEASAPTRGTLVDFDIAEGNRAVSIYVVEPIAPPPFRNRPRRSSNINRQLTPLLPATERTGTRRQFWQSFSAVSEPTSSISARKAESCASY